MTEASKKKALIDHSIRVISRADAAKAKYLESLARDTLYAISWSDSFIKHAVERELYSGLKTTLETSNHSLDQLSAMYTQALVRATGAGTSSSDMSNVVEKTKIRVQAEILDMVLSFASEKD